MDCQQEVDRAVNHIRKQTSSVPEVLVMTGTGLGQSTGSLHVQARIPYGDIPGFPVSTVESHAGELVLGCLGGRQVAVMRGRFHLYEGYSPSAITFPVRVFQAMDVKTMIVTNAAGGVGADFRVGDLMLIEDHINLTGENPLVGPNRDAWGPRFPDMSCVYDRDLGSLAKDTALELGFSLQKGVYLGLKGPSFETPAEIRFFSRMGAHAVGMSTVIEVIAARHAGMRVLGLSTITNINDPDNPDTATIEAIVEEAGKTAERLDRLLTRIVEKM
ncbi:purine-nucleoside phosphorylase [Desulfobotulus sp. H1]|uniref:Purine nucleoside phosphorylase n=1 Tax=Desulfobotulus pelophilus TaxID=2823377 RepID=A0ABT3N921_9BACT|nr:purine-nucleoside phosphorylase [Desulfobotulus pelophilus]MCW7753958.1 purine-nucleoside phosphorylase [Desulfobotulus pelophilus]